MHRRSGLPGEQPEVIPGGPTTTRNAHRLVRHLLQHRGRLEQGLNDSVNVSQKHVAGDRTQMPGQVRSKLHQARVLVLQGHPNHRFQRSPTAARSAAPDHPTHGLPHAPKPAVIARAITREAEVNSLAQATKKGRASQSTSGRAWTRPNALPRPRRSGKGVEADIPGTRGSVARSPGPRSETLTPDVGFMWSARWGWTEGCRGEQGC
jgi:hypothetical protein